MRRLWMFPLGLLVLPAMASAMVVLEASLPQIVSISSLIVHGTVRSVGARTRGDERNIVTDVRLDVIDVVKGSLPSRDFTFTLPGGAAGNYVLRIPGLPQFTEGEEVVLFLESTPDGGHTICGMMQGKFTVTRSGEDGRAFVSRRLDGMGLARHTSTGLNVIHPSPDASAPVALDRFLGELRAMTVAP